MGRNLIPIRQRVDVAHGGDFSCAQRGDDERVFTVLAPQCGSGLCSLAQAPLRERAMIEVVD